MSWLEMCGLGDLPEWLMLPLRIWGGCILVGALLLFIGLAGGDKWGPRLLGAGFILIFGVPVFFVVWFAMMAAAMSFVSWAFGA